MNTKSDTKAARKEQKNNITELVMILDRSGSMGGLESDTIGGFNSMIEAQKKAEGKVYATTILFDNKTEMLHDRVEVSEIRPMTEKEYFVRGCTALLDAIGMAIEHVENIHKYIRKEDVPSHTVVVINTDGMENASRIFNKAQITEMIQGKEKLGWEFLFMGANMDAVGAAKEIGIPEDRAVQFKCDKKGVRLNYQAASDFVFSMRECEARPDGGWKSDIEEDVKKRGH